MQDLSELVYRLSVRRSVFRCGKPVEGEQNMNLVRQALQAIERRGVVAWRPPEEVGLPLLLVRGALPHAKQVAIVGARAVDSYGRACARRVAGSVLKLGFRIVSGGAEGCDAEAHRVALESRSPTVVVLGHGHDHLYPKHHAELFESILNGGGSLVSPYWPTVPPKGYRFRQRNEVIARLARAVVVVRARRKSGTLSTALHARQVGRPLLSIPSDISHALGEGCNWLLSQGALPVFGPVSLAHGLGETPIQNDVWPLNYQGSPSPWDRPISYGAAGLEPHHEALLEVFETHEILDLDDLHMRTGLSVANLLAQLLDLELQGLIQRNPGDQFFRNPSQ
jgi:DNA processing protein